jgi:hypothetical protein
MELNMKKHITLLFLAFAIMQGCTQKSTVKKSSSSSNSGAITFPDSGSIGNSGTNGSTGSTGSNGYNDVADCGQYTNNPDVDSTCYRTLSPTVKLHGQASAGNISFRTSAHASIPQSYFETDLKMYVRIVPKPLDYTEYSNGSLTSRRCSPSTVDSSQNKYRYSKMRVTLEVKKKGSSYTGDIKTIDATLNTGSLTPSSRYRFNTSGPGEYDIIVRDVKTNHRCSNMGTGDLNCSTYQDFPYVTNTSYPTDCVGFEIQFSTDYTRDLP